MAGTVVLAVWSARRRESGGQVREISREHRALVNAADWALRRARFAAGRDQMVLVTVDEVLTRAMEDFGLRRVAREHAAAVLRERLGLLGGCADIVTDADLDPLPCPRTACASHRPLWGDRRSPAW
ncbi:hypothetical protein [Streptacidiphilus sp. PAMC 29251]